MKKLILLSMVSLVFAVSCNNNSNSSSANQASAPVVSEDSSDFTTGRYLGGQPVIIDGYADQFMMNYGSHSITVEASSPVLENATFIDNRTRGTILGKNAEAFSYLANEGEGYHFELYTHFLPQQISLEQFKQHLVEKLSAQAANFELMSEGDDFIEYRLNDMMYYRGFFLSNLPDQDNDEVQGVIAREFIGFGDAEHYQNHRQDYVNTFDNNKAYLVEVMPAIGLTPIMY